MVEYNTGSNSDKKTTKLAKGIYYQNYVIINGKTYIEDGSTIERKYTEKEVKGAKWYYATFKEEVILMPKSNVSPMSDYIIKGERWDLKSPTSNRYDAIYTRIKDSKNQASNFIIDVSKSKLTLKQATRQVEDLYKVSKYKWINIMIIKKNNEHIIVNRQK